MRVATWNVNSIRARIDAVAAWLERRDPDVLLIQETKCGDDVFDTSALRGRLDGAGYEVAHHGSNHYNGVAIASRVGLVDVRRGFTDRQDGVFGEPRLIAATCGGIRMHTVYVPNGRAAHTPHWEAKVAWLEHLRSAIDVTVPAIVAGDVNVQRADIDVYDPRRWRNRNHATPEERAALAALIDDGLRDVVREANPGAGVYTWWNHAADQFGRNRGMRIDLVLCTSDVADRVDEAWIDVDERARPRSSDHAPVVVDLGAPRTTQPGAQRDRRGPIPAIAWSTSRNTTAPSAATRMLRSENSSTPFSSMADMIQPPTTAPTTPTIIV